MEPASQILIVEDSETQALQLRYLLEEEGWEVIRASTAELALDELNRHLPALIIADYHLPGMQGDELCRRVRMNVHTRGIPILMLTAEESSGTEPAGLDRAPTTTSLNPLVPTSSCCVSVPCCAIRTRDPRSRLLRKPTSAARACLPSTTALRISKAWPKHSAAKGTR